MFELSWLTYPFYKFILFNIVAYVARVCDQLYVKNYVIDIIANVLKIYIYIYMLKSLKYEVWMDYT